MARRTPQIPELMQKIQEASAAYSVDTQNAEDEDSLLISRGLLAERLVSLAADGDTEAFERLLRDSDLGKDDAFMALYHEMLAKNTGNETRMTAREKFAQQAYEEAQDALNEYVAARKDAGISEKHTLAEREALSDDVKDNLSNLLWEAADKLIELRLIPEHPENAKKAIQLLHDEKIAQDEAFQSALNNAVIFYMALKMTHTYRDAVNDNSMSDAELDTLREKAANWLVAAYYHGYKDPVCRLVGSPEDEMEGALDLDNALKELVTDKRWKIEGLKQFEGLTGVDLWQAAGEKALKRLENSPTRKVSDVSGSGSRILSMSNERQQ
jgi:hypothetical protein